MRVGTDTAAQPVTRSRSTASRRLNVIELQRRLACRPCCAVGPPRCGAVGPRWSVVLAATVDLGRRPARSPTTMPRSRRRARSRPPATRPTRPRPTSPQADSELEALEEQAAALEQQNAQLQAEVDALRTQVEQIAVHRFMTSGIRRHPAADRLPGTVRPAAGRRARRRRHRVVGRCHGRLRRGPQALEANQREVAANQAELGGPAGALRAAAGRRPRPRSCTCRRSRRSASRTSGSARSWRPSAPRSSASARRAGASSSRPRAEAAARRSRAARRRRGRRASRPSRPLQAHRQADGSSQRRSASANDAGAAGPRRPRVTGAGSAAPSRRRRRPRCGRSADAAASRLRAAAQRHHLPRRRRGAYSDTWGAARSGGRSHQGVDMLTSPRHARSSPSCPARVQFKQTSLGGNSVWLAGNDGNRYFYAHLDSFEGSSRRSPRARSSATSATPATPAAPRTSTSRCTPAAGPPSTRTRTCATPAADRVTGVATPPAGRRRRRCRCPGCGARWR